MQISSSAPRAASSRGCSAADVRFARASARQRRRLQRFADHLRGRPVIRVPRQAPSYGSQLTRMVITRGSGQRSPPHHRDDAACALGQHRRLADARLAARDRRPQSGIAHFVEHMLFKGTGTRTAEDIAQAIDSIGGQLDAFTAKEYASYYIKVLDEHLPLAVDLLSDIVLQPGVLAPTSRAREEGRSSKRSRWSRTRPTIWSTSCSRSTSGKAIALGRPILGSKETVESFTADVAARLFPRRLRRAEPDRLGGRQHRARAGARAGRGARSRAAAPAASRSATMRRASCRR